MSSSSDIEKLFDHFGGDANAYQEIGRENEAHTARTRWPLLVTLDLRQPPIPAIGPHAQTSAKPEPADDEPAAAAPAAARQDAAPKDAVSVMRAKAPLFTRSPRRDIPPVVAAVAAPAGPRGAARFGAVDTSGTTARVSPSGSVDAVPPVAADLPPVSAFTSSSASAPAPAPAATPKFEPAPAATHTSAPPSTSILGKLFSRQDDSAPTRAAAPAAQPVALQSLFDRLRGTPHGTAASARAPEAAAPNSWLLNGPRRS